MLSSANLSRNFRDRFFVAVAAVCLALALLPETALAQFKFREPPGRQLPSRLDEDAGALVWERFLLNRAIGQFRLDGVLLHRPPRDASRSFAFSMEGDWDGRRERTVLTLSAGGTRLRVQAEVDNGRPFLVGAQCADDSPARTPLEGGLLDEPLFEGLPFTWADLLMPYLHWRPVRYLGPERYLGRPAHRFELLNPDAAGFPARAVVTLDESYAALLKADLHDGDGTLARRMRVGGFRQFDGQWMFSELTWENRAARESVRLGVQSFAAAP